MVLRLGALALVAIACGAPPASSVADCASCHLEVAAGFSKSRHANTGSGVVYRALLGTRSASEQAFCEGCHSRGGTGLSCTDCHAAVGNETTSNGLLRFGDSSVVGTARPVLAPHQTEVRPFLSSSDLCGTCHEVHGPAFFVETPFTEWSAGAKVKTCAQCHFEASSHSVSGIHDDASALLADAVSLTLAPVGDEVELTLTSNVQGHAFPSGSSFARRLQVTVPGALEVNFDDRPLQASETKRWRFTPRSRCVRATVTFWRYRPELLASLGVAAENAPLTLSTATLGCEAEPGPNTTAP